jgi:uncharacterized lipoprotein YddW (UPF0748 family)
MQGTGEGIVAIAHQPHHQPNDQPKDQPRQKPLRIWGVLLAALGLVGGAAPAWGAEPTDLDGHWTRGCVSALAARRWIVGDGSGRVRPEEAIAARDFATLLNRAVPEGMALPPEASANRPVTRSQALTWLAWRLGWTAQGDPRASAILQQTFEDGAAVPWGDRVGVAAALRRGAIALYPPSRRLNGAQPLKRGEAAAWICLGLADRLETPATDSLQALAVRPAEIRGVWLTNIDSDVLFEAGRLRGAIAELRELGFNTIYPTVWNGGYTLYPSAVAAAASGIAVDPHPGLAGRDAIGEAIAAAREAKLTAIPWLEFGLMAPADSALARRNPDWLLQRQDGTTVDDRSGSGRVWLNPSHPEVRRFVVNLAVEVVTRYGADGLQFDDHFAWPVDFGYDPVTVANWRRDRPPIPAPILPNPSNLNNSAPDDAAPVNPANPGEVAPVVAIPAPEPPTDPSDRAWMQWRADQLSTLWQEIHAAVKAAKPTAIVSLSPNPAPFAYETALQDWPRWVSSGWVDEAIVQIYRQDVPSFEEHLREANLQRASYRIPVAIGVLSGLRPKPVAIAVVEGQTRSVRRFQLSGISYFFYETLWNLTPEPAQQRRQGLRRLLFHPAPRPLMTAGTASPNAAAP